VIKKQLNFYLLPLLIVILIYLGFISLALLKYNFDFSRFIGIGDAFVVKENLAKNISYFEDSYGYDGEFYFRLALNPFTNKVEDYGIILDVPSYRHQRIMYPILVWIFSLGNIQLVPFMMLFINFVALCVITILGSYFARLLNLSSFWGVLFTLYPGFLYSLSSSLSEIVQTCFLLGALIMLKKQKNLFAAVFLSFAVLTRETSLVIPLFLLFSKKRKYMFIPVLSYFLFQFILLYVWGAFSFSSKASAFGLPFFGLGSFVFNQLTTSHSPKVYFLQLGYFVVFSLSIFWASKFLETIKYIKPIFFIYGFLGLCFSSLIWVEDKAFLRALNEFYLLGIIILLSSKSNLRNYIFPLTLMVWFATLMHIV